MLAEICREHKVDPAIVQRLLQIENTPPRKGRRGVGVRTRELIESFATRPEQGQAALADDAVTFGFAPISAPGPSIRLLEVRMQNFGLFQDGQVSFPRDAERPVSIIEGENGHGKSTLLHALRFALHGADRARLTGLLCQGASPPTARMEVCLRFDADAQGEVLLKRYAVFESGPAGWEAGSPQLTVAVLGGDVAETLHDEAAEEWIEMYFPKAVLDFFCFDAENSVVNQMAEGNGKFDVGEALEAILGISSIRRAAERCRQLVKEWDQEARTVPESDTPKQARARKAEIEARQESVERRQEACRRERDQVVEELARVGLQLQDLLARFDPRAEAERLEGVRRLEAVRIQLERRQGELEELVGLRLPLQLLGKPLAQILDAAWRSRREDPGEAAAETLAGVARLAVAGHIPWVEEPMPTEEAIVGRLMQALGLTGSGLRLEMSEAERAALSALQSKALEGPGARDAVEGLRRLRSQQRTLQAGCSHVVDGAAHAALLAEHNRLLARQEELVTRRTRLEEETIDLTREGEELARDLEESLRTGRLAQENYRRAKVRKERVKLAREAGQALAAFAEKLRALRVDTLERQATAMLCRTTNKPGLVGRLAFDRKTLRYRVLDTGGRPVPARRSTGEKTVLAMAVVHGLQQASGRMLPLIVEAPLKPLDPCHTRGVLQHFFANHPGQSILLVKPGELPEELVPVVAPRVGRWLRLHRPEPGAEVSVFAEAACVRAVAV